jgi:hypothetical protein
VGPLLTSTSHEPSSGSDVSGPGSGKFLMVLASKVNSTFCSCTDLGILFLLRFNFFSYCGFFCDGSEPMTVGNISSQKDDV